MGYLTDTWVLFDLDGTLTRSEEGIWNCVRYVAERMNLPVPDDAALRKFIGPPLVYSFQEYMGMTEEQACKAQDIYRERYVVKGRYENRVYPGIRNALRALRREGASLGVVTGKPEGSTRAILQYFGLDGYFSTLACATDGHAEKDHLIRQALPSGAERVWMVGDRKFDMEGAVKAKVHALGVTYGYGSAEELWAAGAEALADTPWEIAERLIPDVRKPEGAFLSMEGLDGSGKGTQMERLTDMLDRFGFEVMRSREPGGSPIGEKIRDLLLSRENAEMTAETEALLYAAARAQHVRQVIRPAVTDGKVLLCDRFLDSSVAYQGGGRQLGVNETLAINAPAVDGTLPDITVFLDLDHRTSLARRSAVSELDRLEMEQESFFARVEDAYHELIARNPGRYVVVDARGNREEIAREIAEKVLKRLMETED